MLTPSQLRAKFPSDAQIQDRSDATLQSTIDAVIAEANGYTGIEDENPRLQAIALHAAHYVRLETISESPAGRYGMPTKIKSKDDEIGYAGDRSFDLSSTAYGQRLQKLLDSQYVGGFLV